MILLSLLRLSSGFLTVCLPLWLLLLYLFNVLSEKGVSSLILENRQWEDDELFSEFIPVARVNWS